jgi:hypothetical protein
MVVTRTCKARTEGDEPCRAAPLLDSEFCFVHCPDHAAEMQEARRLGGLRRRRERTVAGAYDVEGLGTVLGIRRVLEIVTFDGLGMENSVARGRMLIAAMQVAAKLLETGELEQRVAELESILKPRIEAAKGRRR